MKKLKIRSLTILVVAMFALLFTGCGGGGGGGNTSPEDGVYNTTRNFLVQWGKHNVDKAMSYVSPEYFESGQNYSALRNSIAGSSRFEVSNFKITTYSFDADKVWCDAYVDCYLDGIHTTGWMYLHKRSGWMISGQDGRGLHTGDSIILKMLKNPNGTSPPASDLLPPSPDGPIPPDQP